MPDSLLLKFQQLPDATKANASDPEAMRTLDSLEKQYSVNLAELVMRVMVQEVAPASLDEVLEKQYNVVPGKGKELAKHLLDDLFFKFRLLEVPDVRDTLTAELPKPTLTPQAGASPFLLHPDDHKDLAPHVAALTSTPPSVVDTNPVHVAGRLLAMEKLQLDPMLLKRFQKIVESRLVDVRDKMETQSMLTRPEKIGGMGFDEARADRIGNELQTTVEELHRRPKVAIAPPRPVVPPVTKMPPAQPKPTPPPAPKPAVSPQMQTTPSPALRASRGAPDGSHPPAAPARREDGEVGSQNAVSLPTSSAQVVTKPKVAPPPWLRPVQTPAPMVRPASTPIARPATPRPAPPAPRPAPSYRDVVTDVRAPARVMGPIEVLGSLTIDDFRRLGETAGDRIRKIVDEVEALGRDSFAQRAAGIAAFRQSPTFKAYLAIGQRAMERKEEVADILDLMKAQGEPSLTAEEFEAIGTLMRQFRY